MSETPDELRARAEDLRDHFTDDGACSCMSAEEAADVIEALRARLATAEADLAQIINAPIAMTERVPGGLVPLVRAVAAVAGRRHAEARLARREQP